MTITNEQLAELLVGITRGQQAIIDAIESETAGWRNTHLLPKLNTASNIRLAIPRLIDVPARILLRSQTRVPMDAEAIALMLDIAMGAAPTPESVATAAAPAPAPAKAKDEDLDFFAN